MNESLEQLILIAGKGAYPLELAESARRQGIRRLVVAAFKGETDHRIRRHADSVEWIRLGQFDRMLDVLKAIGIRHAVMAGQITPTSLFHVRPDARALALLGRLRERNAATIFGAVADELHSIGIEVLPAHLFMESAMPHAGQLSARAPTEIEEQDIAFGLRVAKATSGLHIGQTVVIRQGTILAVEAFEGTDATIRRAGRICGPGAVVIKVARRGHDMRFDIPVVGMRTMKVLRRIRAAALAVEAGRCIILERSAFIAAADRVGMSVTAVKVDDN